MPPNDVTGGAAPCRWEPDNPTLFPPDLFGTPPRPLPPQMLIPFRVAPPQKRLVRPRSSKHRSHLSGARTALWSPQLAGRACADHFLCGTFLSAALTGPAFVRGATERHDGSFMSRLFGGVGNGPPELLPLSFSLIVMSPVWRDWGGGSLMNKLSRFCCQSTPPPPFPKPQPAEDAG